MFEKLAGRKPEYIDNLRKYAVAVPYLPKEEAILFEVRADSLKRQPGEISFPGGCVEAGETFWQAAVRETAEELLLPEQEVQIIAPLDRLLHFGSSIICPYLAVLQNYDYTYSTDEVKEVFTVPFRYFLDNQPMMYHNEISVTSVDEQFPYNLIGTESYPWATTKHSVLFYQYEGKVIWGMTAKIMKNLIDIYKASYAG